MVSPMDRPTMIFFIAQAGNLNRAAQLQVQANCRPVSCT
jgi:hypothetical protein